VYRSNKAAQEAFTNALRNELSGTNIRVMALQPGCVATNFHSQRVGHDKEMYNSFFEGFQYVLSFHAIGAAKFACEPLEPVDIAESAIYMLEQPLNRSVKALDVVPSGMYSSYLRLHYETRANFSEVQRSLTVFDRGWNKRNAYILTTTLCLV